MATFVCIHGAGGRGSDWRLVAGHLEAAGHEVVAVDLPCEEPVGLDAYVTAVVDAIGSRRVGLVLVAQSLGGLVAPVVADRLPVELLVLVTAMVPLPGETGGEWWENTGHEAAVEALGLSGGSDLFTHDVDPAVLATFEPPRDQTGEVLDDPCPLDAWPRVPTSFLLCRDDRFFPPDWMREVVRQRLGIEPIEVPGGHCAHLSRPEALAAAILACWAGRESAGSVSPGPSAAK